MQACNGVALPKKIGDNSATVCQVLLLLHYTSCKLISWPILLLCRPFDDNSDPLRRYFRLSIFIRSEVLTFDLLKISHI